MHWLELGILIGVLSLVQSLFGVGLLVFGTPLLLLLGYSFLETLSILLPCSVLISLIQVVHGWKDLTILKNEIAFWTIPAVAVGLLLILFLGKSYEMRFWVGLILLFSASLRLSKYLTKTSRIFAERYKRPFLMLMGLIHGMTNLGGGLLTIFVNALFDKKEVVRAHIAFGYLWMAMVQMIVLLVRKDFSMNSEVLLFPVVSGAVYFLAGRRLFQWTHQTVYQHIMTLFMVLFGCVMICL